MEAILSALGHALGFAFAMFWEILWALIRKGANFTAAIAFEFASTNLVIELGIIMVLLLGWQFTLAEFLGGLSMVAILAVLFKAFLRPELVREAREQAE